MVCEYKKIFRKIFGGVNIVSTTDHPYSSPPARLLSTHYILNQLRESGANPLLVCWDTIKPPQGGLYRSSMGLDIGLVSIHDSSLFFYDSDKIYPQQNPRDIDFKKLKKYLDAILENMSDLRKERKEENNSIFRKNFDTLVSEYQTNLAKGKNSYSFYVDTLSSLYALFGMGELKNLVEDKMISLYYSANIRNWIVWSMRELEKEDELQNLLFNKEIFLRRLFRTLGFEEIQYNKSSKDKILRGIEDGKVLFSHELFFFMLALAGVKHFGNDRGFFLRLSQVPAFSSCSTLQMTEYNKDSYKIVEILSSKNFSVSEDEKGVLVKKANKISNKNLDTMTMLFCHIKEPQKIIRTLLLGRGDSQPLKIHMGRVFVYKPLKNFVYQKIS